MKKYIVPAFALVLVAAALAAAAEDPVLTYSDKVQDVVNRLNARLNEAAVLLVWPGDNLDQDSRDKIVWKLEVVINDIGKLKAELDALAVPAGFEDTHKLISGSLDLYMTAVSRCGTGIEKGYVKTFNGGVQDYNNASNYLDNGMEGLANDLRKAGYQVN